MLVLSRKQGQEITIGEGENLVTLYVADIQHDQVRLAFDAPREIRIMRTEVDERIKREAIKT